MSVSQNPTTKTITKPTFDLLAPVIGKPKPKTPEQIKAEEARLDADAKYKENPGTAIEMMPLITATTGVGGRRRKSRRGKSRKYKRTLKRRKNKTKK
jgi:hypothetical protein